LLQQKEQRQEKCPQTPQIMLRASQTLLSALLLDSMESRDRVWSSRW